MHNIAHKNMLSGNGVDNKLADFKATAFNYSLSPETFGKEMYRVVIHLDNGLKQEVFLNENSEKAGDLNGKANGLAKYFELSGNLKEKGIYKNGKRVGKWEFYLDGEITENTDAKKKKTFSKQKQKDKK